MDDPKENMGAQVEVIAFGKSSSGKLREIADDFLDLSESPRKYLINMNIKRLKGIGLNGFMLILIP
jgi:hypothetical protein